MMKNLVKPALWEVLSVILPTQEQTWLLRSCLLPLQSARQAWARFQEKTADPLNFLTEDKQGIKRLLPLLFIALQRHGVEIDPPLLTVLRTAHTHEELRTKVVYEICKSVLSLFLSARSQVIVLKGVVLAETVYKDRGFRHCHDIDVLIGQSDSVALIKSLETLRFQLAPKHLVSTGEDLLLRHESGLPLFLHRYLFPIPFFNGVLGDVWSRCEIKNVSGVQTRVLSPADNLLHHCGLLFCGGKRKSLLWACDSWLIIDRHPDLDWDVVYHYAKHHCLTYPLSVTLGYLAEELNAPIPDSFLDRLYSAASRSTFIEREVALQGARSSLKGGFRRLFQKANTWRAKMSILQWMVFPTPQYVRWLAQRPRNWLLPIFYVYRPLRYISRRIVSLIRNHLQPKSLQNDLGSSGPSSRPFITFKIWNT